MRIFETLKPKNNIIQKYVSYYYLDIADDLNYFNQYTCYPHFNNTISLYKNHVVDFLKEHSVISFKKDADPVQIFTPLREKILKVTQNGPVHKIGIVFNPLGINQFLREDINISKIISSPSLSFFDNDFILQLFGENNLDKITSLLDNRLLDNFVNFDNAYLLKAISLLHGIDHEFNIDELAESKLGISRKHLNRLFKKYIGTNPQKYRTIVRFRQLMDYKLKPIHQSNYTSLSHQVHYTDQSHFIKACKQLTNLTPSQFFKEGKIVGSEDTFWNFMR
ncbi:hypothetical protein GCM10022246_12980 [Pedobacter ginsengiterrae]|uniref:HTH araC/xylS-type domain-containing protein n=1 Tax=Pedobacter ginsengiterrae TaxID=871696 RepID=A0ABP7P7Z7_9SPHI